MGSGCCVHAADVIEPGRYSEDKKLEFSNIKGRSSSPESPGLRLAVSQVRNPVSAGGVIPHTPGEDTALVNPFQFRGSSLGPQTPAEESAPGGLFLTAGAITNQSDSPKRERDNLDPMAVSLSMLSDTCGLSQNLSTIGCSPTPLPPASPVKKTVVTLLPPLPQAPTVPHQTLKSQCSKFGRSSIDRSEQRARLSEMSIDGMERWVTNGSIDEKMDAMTTLHHSNQSMRTDNTWKASDMQEVTVEGATTSAQSRGGPWGRLVGMGGEASVELSKPLCTAGRASSCEVRIKNPLVSTEHFTVRVLDRRTGSVELENHSRNMTYLNGESIPKGGRRTLVHGDTIQYFIASTRKQKVLAEGFVFQLLSEEEKNAAKKPTNPMRVRSLLPSRSSDSIVTHSSTTTQSPSSRRRSGTIPYKVGTELLGAGGFGKVYLGMNRASGELLAVKQVPLAGLVTTPEVQQLQQEIDVLSTLRHGNIVQYHGADRTSDGLVILLEYVPGGSVASLLRKFGAFNESVARAYMAQIVVGLRFLHHHSVIHGDLKAANILVTQSGKAKVSDFGASCKALEGQQEGRRLQGTPAWMAPEAVREGGNSMASDMWSLGCTFVEMVSARNPWSEKKFDNSLAVLHFLRSNDSQLPELPKNLSPEARRFAFSMLQLDPEHRLNCDDLLQTNFIQEQFLAQLSERQVSPQWCMTDGHASEVLTLDITEVSPPPTLNIVNIPPSMVMAHEG
eukprot:Hpha_TRINITY_DN13258_c0_g1::TRINITY_DN13258_c0_g1_i1::g.155022::m.155022